MATDDEREPRGADAQQQPSWLRRIGWLALIWTASVAALLVVAMLFRLAMQWAGLTADG